MMRTMTRLITAALAGAILALSGCALTRPAPTFPPSPAGTPAPSPAPAPEQPGTPGPQAPTPAERPPAPPPRQFHLSAASGALVTQAHAQAAGGDLGQSSATLERALRIEPDNPLLWIELGRVRLAENNAGQADAMGRKALALSTGDGATQGSAWRLISEALKAQGKNGEAAEAERHADAAAPH
jgi:tetratricopeptide (TPR) repeat protein